MYMIQNVYSDTVNFIQFIIVLIMVVSVRVLLTVRAVVSGQRSLNSCCYC